MIRLTSVGRETVIQTKINGIFVYGTPSKFGCVLPIDLFIIKSYTEYKYKKKQIKELKEKKLVACNILNNTVNLLRAKPRGGER